MFNLLVSSRPWDSSNCTYPADRMFEDTEPDLMAAYSDGTGPNFTKLKELPTLFVEETDRANPHSQFAKVGKIISAYQTERTISIQYLIDYAATAVPQIDLIRMAPQLGIILSGRRFHELATSHWSVKRADLFEQLYKGVKHSVRQPKVFHLNESQIVDAQLVSVMMPFAGFDNVYSVIQKAVTTAGMRHVRADNVWDHAIIIEDIVSIIDRAAVVVCDCTGRNPNVFYEIGIAHSLGKEVILLTQNSGDIPFDLLHHRYVTYLNNGEGLQRLEYQLIEKLRNLQTSALRN